MVLFVHILSFSGDLTYKQISSSIYGLCNAIRSGFKMTTHVAPSKALEPIIPEAVQLVVKTNVGCSHIYQSLLKNKVK